MLHSQIKDLFGQHTITQAGRVDLSQVNAPLVGKAVGALLLLKGKPEAQMAYVRSMPDEQAAVLCRWLSDPTFWRKVGEIKEH